LENIRPGLGGQMNFRMVLYRRACCIVCGFAAEKIISKLMQKLGNGASLFASRNTNISYIKK
jgi:hypothetical protein